MRRKLKRCRALIFALSILISFCLAHLQYDNLGGTRLFSADLGMVSFEAADEEDILIVYPASSKGFLSAFQVNLNRSGNHSFRNFIPSHCQPSYQQETFNLRR
jgi:hypothetical protein